MSTFKFLGLKYFYKIVDERINNGYVELRILKEDGRTKWIKRYRIVFELYCEDLKYGYQIHHKDMNKLNDRPSNLIQITREEHTAIHGKIYSEESFGGSKRMFGKKHSEETKLKMSKAMMGNKNTPLFRSEEYCENAKIRQSNFKNSNARKDITIDMIIELKNKNYSNRKIAKILGCSNSVVGKRLEWFNDI